LFDHEKTKEIMKVLHISTECYPAAKAGGMGDVVGALPAYLPEFGIEASVIIPQYQNKWFAKNKFKRIFNGSFVLGRETVAFSVEKYEGKDLGFPFYSVKIPGKFDRPHIYLAENGEAYPDELSRNLSFQIAVLHWILSDPDMFDLLHCHDHMTGLISFMMKYCEAFKILENKPSFFTIHNGQYRGIFDWSKVHLIPKFDSQKGGYLDWDNQINSLAAAIKCSWRINTVSPSYMEELQNDFDSLTSLARFEKYKSIGILNGIDNNLWDPQTDPMLKVGLKRSATVFKSSNKKELAKEHGFNSNRPLFSFIGRFAYEKAADILAHSFDLFLQYNPDVHIFILGSGDKSIERDILYVQQKYPDNITAVIAYDETLAHQIYAASDFILMPSRFEPCGLNQMYAMRYGTVPIVRKTGGLKDTVPDIGDGGNGINFVHSNANDVVYSMDRAYTLYQDKLEHKTLINKIMSLDFSWTKSAEKYSEQYALTIKN
jgi:starch synthase